MPVLYLTEQGAVLRQAGKRLIIVKEDEKIADLPLIKLDSVLIYGHLQITTQALRTLLEQGVQTSFLTLNGRLIGHLAPLKSKNSLLRIRQYFRASDPSWCLIQAQSIVEAKIRNSQRVLERYLNNHPQAEIQQIRAELNGWMPRIRRKQTPQNLLGVEGSGTQRYYDAFRLTFRGELKFNGRNRRPPRDEINSLLSFGYTLLGNELTALIEARGLDPYLGIYHGIQYGRPSLAMDILEAFRPAVDLFTLNLANLKILQPHDFEQRNGGIFLTKKGIKTYFHRFEIWMNSPDKTGTTMRNWLRHQVHAVARAVENNSNFIPYRIP